MCGICGIYKRGDGEIILDNVVKMRDVMINRGPDDEGCYNGRHVALGHRRLSIIDLSPAGRQPMSNEDNMIWVVCNGEIYNFIQIREELIGKGHVFKSKTDIEVIIHGYEEWGIERLLKKINGMFAFAIWDTIKQELILARDRLGVKPLFYLENNGTVYFSSDIKSIWIGCNKSLALNHRAIDHFLYSYCIPQEYTIFENVRKVLPSQYIRFNEKGVFYDNYWDLSFEKKEIMTENEYIDELSNVLTAAVRRRMISDVSLGAFLSGGVDSSLVVAAMAGMSDRPIKTFSIGFKQESYNELKYAKMVAEEYSTDHHELIVEPDALNILPEIIWNYGEPFADASQIPTYYVSRIAKQDVTVALTGDGGDESFGGYKNIINHYWGSYYRKYLPVLFGEYVFPQAVNSLISAFGRRGILSKAKSLIEYGSGNFGKCFNGAGILRTEQREKLYSQEFKRKLAGHDPTDIYEKYIISADGLNEVDKALYVDIKTRLPNDYLTKVDVATMMASLEARSPFLDVELMEFAAKIPANIKVKQGRQKYLLKKMASRVLPHEVVFRKKWGFGMPIGFWFRDNLEPLIRKVLLNERSLKRGYFMPGQVKKLIDEHVAGKADHKYQLWSLLCLELWHLMFMDKVISRESKLI